VAVGITHPEDYDLEAGVTDFSGTNEESLIARQKARSLLRCLDALIDFSLRILHRSSEAKEVQEEEDDDEEDEEKDDNDEDGESEVRSERNIFVFLKKFKSLITDISQFFLLSLFPYRLRW